MINHKIARYNIFIGNHPKMEPNPEEYLKDFDVVINVSDEPFFPTEKLQHWMPLNEVSQWDYSMIYWFAQLMNYYISQNKKIYVHCMAGVNRSPTLTYLFLLSLGHSEEEADFMFSDELIIFHKKMTVEKTESTENIEYINTQNEFKNSFREAKAKESMGNLLRFNTNNGHVKQYSLDIMKYVKSNPNASMMSVLSKFNALKEVN